MNGVVATILIVLVSAMTLFALRDDAMKTCELTHSHETCVYELVR